MQIIPILTAIIFGPIVALSFLQALYQTGVLTFIFSAVAIVVCAFGLITLGKVLYEKHKEQALADEAEAYRQQQQQQQEREAARVRQELYMSWRTEVERLYALAKRTYPPVEMFVLGMTVNLEKRITEGGLRQPSKTLWPRILAAVKDLYERSIPDTSGVLPLPAVIDETNYTQECQRLQVFASYGQNFNETQIANNISNAILGFLQQLPHTTEGQFKVPVKGLLNTKVPQVVADMMWALDNPPVLPDEHSHLWVAARSAGKLFGKRKDAMIFPQDWEGNPMDAISHYLPPSMQVFFNEEMPFGIPDETRYMHHHCLGKFGSGKTTYLSHFILKDLKRVLDNEASLVVIDSQRLVKQISHTKLFAPDGPFFDRVVIIDASKDYPLALNPFRINSGNPERDRTATVDVLTYAFNTGADTTDLQEGALDWVITAASFVPDADLDTLLAFFKPQKGRDWDFPFPEVWDDLDKNTRYYFEHVFGSVQTQTKNGLRQRIMNLRRNPAVERMFNAPDNKIDMFEDFQKGGKVFLIDTSRADLGKGGCETFGRLFIAMLDRVSSRRGGFSERTLKPIFITIDEAHDYIQHDPVFADMLVKTRNKRLAFTVAHHYEGQVKNSDAREGLQQTAIHSHCPKRGVPVEVDIEGKEYHIPVSKFEWDNEQDVKQMSPAEYHTLRQHIYSKYGATNQPKASPADDIPLTD